MKQGKCECEGERKGEEQSYKILYVNGTCKWIVNFYCKKCKRKF